MEIVPFGETLLDEAAELLAARHRAQREAEPALPARFAEPGGARAAVASAWRAPGASGVAALGDGRLVGFLIGAPELDPVWGRSAWVRLGGHALATIQSTDLYRDLYAALSPEWVAMECFFHYAMIPASDRPALDAWFTLSFGQQQTHAIRALPAPELAAPSLNPAIQIRRAGPADLELLLEVADMVALHQARSPVYGPFLTEMRSRWRADYAELLADARVAIWLALREDMALGFAIFEPTEPGDGALYVPERCCEVLLAGTRATERGQGIGQALTAHGLAHAHAAGFAHCVTDWRTTNLLASRFWPRQGFRPVAYRLARIVDQRIAWAYGGA